MIGQLLDGRYRVVQVLSSGAFGQTYLAADTRRPGHPQCVVKQLRPPGNSYKIMRTAHRLFKQEAEILERLGRHEQIPLLLAYFHEKDEFYLVEEFIPGNPLNKEIVPGLPWKEDKVTLLVSEILEILIFVHGQGVIHRDVNPSNLIRRKSDGRLVLIDFGSVKEVRTIMENTNGRIQRTIATGTPSYMPLEQFQGNPQFNSDLYAVGTIAIQALTGLPSSDLPKLQDTSPSGAGKNLWRDRVECSGTLGDIIDKMVEHHFSQRYQSAVEALTALRKMKSRKVSLPPAVIQLPPKKSKVDWLKAGNKWRRWLLASFAGLGLLIVLVGLLNFIHRPTPKRAEAYYLRAIEKLEEGDDSGAMIDLNKSIDLDPERAEVFYGRGNLYHKQGKNLQAIADYSQAIALNPSYTNAYFNRGLARDRIEDYPGAIEDYTKVLEFQRQDAGVYYLRGVANYNLQDYEAAIADYTEAIRLQSKNTKAYLARGLARSSSGNLQGAVADYSKAIELEPNNFDAYYNRGIALFARGDYESSLNDRERAIEIDPNNAKVYANGCSTYFNLTRYELAIADCNRALELAPDDADSYNNRCAAYLNLKQLERAISDCSRAIEIDAKHYKAYSNRGLVHQEIGEPEGAIADYTVAININPNNAAAYANRAEVYYNLQDYEKAIADYARAIGIKPNYAQAYYGRGMVRAALGDRKGAISDFETAGKLYLEKGLSGGFKDSKYQLEQLNTEEK